MLKKLSPIEILFINFISGIAGIYTAVYSWYFVSTAFLITFMISFLIINVRKDIK